MPMFDMQETRQRVVDTIVQQLKVDRTSIDDAVTLESLGADSLDIVQLIMKLEEEFGIEISDTDAEKMNSLADIVAYIHGRRTR